MTPVVWTVAAMAYVSLWIWWCARYTSSQQADDTVRSIGQVLPACVVTTALVAFAVGPGRGSTLTALTLWIHHGSILLLFLFLVSGQYLLTEARIKIRNGAPPRAVAATYRRLWMLTETTPAPAAAAVLLSGLRLIWEAPSDHSSSVAWVFILVAGFSLFFFDGLLGYRVIVRQLYETWRFATIDSSVARPGDTWPHIQLSAHFLSFPPLFVVGVVRWNPPNPLAPFLDAAERRLAFLPLGWPEVATALFIFVAAGAVAFVVRGALDRVARPSRAGESVAAAGAAVER